ncbi:unnamed protein product, partial [Mesorhabditis belari]|uniref:Uncharacterized protein n=1 Tax=Mesorhabditis belari TaxID=2138241 RepID=A0AAF3FLZ8_9BILA
MSVKRRMMQIMINTCNFYYFSRVSTLCTNLDECYVVKLRCGKAAFELTALSLFLMLLIWLLLMVYFVKLIQVWIFAASHSGSANLSRREKQHNQKVANAVKASMKKGHVNLGIVGFDENGQAIDERFRETKFVEIDLTEQTP